LWCSDGAADAWLSTGNGTSKSLFAAFSSAGIVWMSESMNFMSSTTSKSASKWSGGSSVIWSQFYDFMNPFGA
jgi:hypothetical protein